MSLPFPARRGWSALVAALALLLTSACSDDPGQADTESLSDTASEEPAEADEEAPAETEPATAASEPEGQEPQGGAEPAEQGPPLASTTMPISFVEGGEMEVAVTSLDMAGELMRMGITFTMSLPVEVEEVGIGAVLTADENAPAAGIWPEIIDPVNLKAYQAVAGYIPNGTGIYLRDGASHTIVCYYAAPQEDVETVDVKLSSQTPPITDVPFQP